jgi:hypothetical protein
MTQRELREILDEHGLGVALAMLEKAGLPEDEEEALAELAEAWEAERIRPWLSRRRFSRAFNPHEF